MPRKALDPTVAELLKKYGLDPKDALWDCHGTWVMYHWAVERAAAKADVQFSNPTIIEANSKDKIVSMMVTATLGDKSAWSIGEAAPANCKNSYVYAMAEKRAKDRAALKVLGLHGIYSEEEADDFKKDKPLSEDRAGSRDDDSGTFTIPTTKANGEKKVLSYWLREFSTAMDAAADSHEIEGLLEHNKQMLDWCQENGNYDPIQQAIDRASARITGAAA